MNTPSITSIRANKALVPTAGALLSSMRSVTRTLHSVSTLTRPGGRHSLVVRQKMNSSIISWPFDQPRNCATFTVRQVMQKEEPILTIAHAKEDHSWSFVGSTGFSMKDAILVGLEEVVKLDLSTLEVADLPPGWQADRESPNHPWIRSESPPDEEENGA